MRTIHVKYDEVYAETARLRSQVLSGIVGQADTGYGRIQSTLNRMDGAANAQLTQVLEANRQ
ncbi:MAG: hypothetical protein FWE20_10455 [Defluviitaleaceae bacterium]|nr:hypothetical protein [Defluviitaleaceae bacterium]